MRKGLWQSYGPAVGRESRAAGTRLVLAAGAVMILLQLGFRAWVLFPSWFFLDDYNLLNDALEGGVDAEYLMQPYNGHLMPAGRLVVWLVAASGDLNWPAAVVSTLVFQALSSGFALWMLVTLFGRRLAVLLPFALYLSSAMTIPALLWWSAALTLLPLQAAFFAAVGCWVRYLRAPTLPWLAGTILSVLAGLTFDVKGILVAPVLFFLAVGYFASGRLDRRIVHIVRTYWPAAVASVVLIGGYVTYYVAAVPTVETSYDLPAIGTIASSMLGNAFPTGALGGPWRWLALAPPTAFADAPDVAVHASWVGLAMVAAYAALRRERTLRAWALLAGYLLILLALLAISRGTEFGAVIGLEYRYLTDAVCVLTLVLGLVFLPLRGALESSTPRPQPLLTAQVPTAWVLALTLLVVGSGVVSSVSYTRYWHSDNASQPYLQNLRDDLRAEGEVDLADTVVPEPVLSQLTAPLNTSRRLATLASDRVTFPDVSDNLAVVADDGRLHSAAIQLGVGSVEGPVEDCGWRVRSRGRTIPLTGRAFEWEWWVRIGYLGSQESDVVVSAGTSRIETTVQGGLNSLYVRVEGGFDSVRIDGLAPGVTLCVDTVEVGQPVPGGRLS